MLLTWISESSSATSIPANLASHNNDVVPFSSIPLVCVGAVSPNFPSTVAAYKSVSVYTNELAETDAPE